MGNWKGAGNFRRIMSVEWGRQKSDDGSLQRTDEEKQRISKCRLALKKSGCGRRVRSQTVARGGPGSRPFSQRGQMQERRASSTSVAEETAG